MNNRYLIRSYILLFYRTLAFRIYIFVIFECQILIYLVMICIIFCNLAYNVQ